MTSRIPQLLAAFALLAASCSSTNVDDTSSVGDDSTDSVDSAADSVVEETTNTTMTVPAGPTTTFVPALEGPFDLTGGVTFDPATADVIIDAEPALPPTLAQLPFETDWTRRTVDDWTEFLRGLAQTDPRDAIPPIDTPVFETTTLAAQWLGPREPGALVQVGDEARFYPLSILTRHEIVNDVFGDVPVAVTFCPLCNTALAFDRRVNGETLRFGVSGLLRNSDLVMWDDKTTSLWQQIIGEAVVGEFAGARLGSLPTSIVSFSQFAENFPDGRSLSGDSGFGRRSYGQNPYANYSSLPRPFLYNGETDDRLEPLQRVVGISDGETVVAYSFDRVQSLGVINDIVDGRAIAVFAAGDTADALGDVNIAIAEAIGSAVAYDPLVDGDVLTFQKNADDTFTDDQTGSTWSIVGRATDGSLAGTQLGAVQHRNEFWFAWQAFFDPDSLREG